MKSIGKRLLSILLSVTMLFTIASTSAWAIGENEDAVTVKINLSGMVQDTTDAAISVFVRQNTKFEGITEYNNGGKDSVTFSGDTYSYTIPRPYSDDMTQEEIENSAIAPYMYYTNPEDNKTYKLTCTGYKINGRDPLIALNEPVTISKNDPSKTLVLMWTKELVQAQAITYSFGETPEMLRSMRLYKMKQHRHRLAASIMCMHIRTDKFRSNLSARTRRL